MPRDWLKQVFRTHRIFLQGEGYVSTVRLFFSTLLHEGPCATWRKASTALTRSRYDASLASQARRNYAIWRRRYDALSPNTLHALRERNHSPDAPLISVLMPVHDPNENFLEQAIRSVRDQTYPRWQLCIADDASSKNSVRDILRRHATEDPRIVVRFRPRNGHIAAASNSALELAEGDFIALLDHDDLLPPHAFSVVAETIQGNPRVRRIYTDEDKIDAHGNRSTPYFKCTYNPDLMLSHNMICHLEVYETGVVRQIGGFRPGLDGAQDYDLALRVIERIASDQIVHIPKVLYHWRMSTGSTAAAGAAKPYALLAGLRAIVDHLQRRGVQASVELLDYGIYRVRYLIPEPPPLVSLIIPSRNRHELLDACLESIFSKTTYPCYEVIIVDNASDEPETLDLLDKMRNNPAVRVIRDDRPFNFPALINGAVIHAKGQMLTLVNNDVQIITPEWLQKMVSLVLQPNVGAVGARLWFPDDTLQHGGIILGIGGVAGHGHMGLPRGNHGYFYRASLIQTVSAVTAACLVIRKTIYQQEGGMDEVNLPMSYNDVDFCLRVRAAGYRNIYTPFAELYHHEFASRGHDDTPEKRKRHQAEVGYLRNTCGNLLFNDPAYSPNLSLEHCDFSYA